MLPTQAGGYQIIPIPGGGKLGLGWDYSDQGTSVAAQINQQYPWKGISQHEAIKTTRFQSGSKRNVWRRLPRSKNSIALTSLVTLP
jgi:hypothetical protein